MIATREKRKTIRRAWETSILRRKITKMTMMRKRRMEVKRRRRIEQG